MMIIKNNNNNNNKKIRLEKVSYVEGNLSNKVLMVVVAFIRHYLNIYRNG
jgi:hypothetical protein